VPENGAARRASGAPAAGREPREKTVAAAGEARDGLAKKNISSSRMALVRALRAMLCALRAMLCVAAAARRMIAGPQERAAT